jgi:hypothetical protein
VTGQVVPVNPAGSAGGPRHERYLYNHHVSGAPAPLLPAIQPTPGLPIFTTNVGQYSNQFIMRPAADPAGEGRLQGQFNIIKLHGSFSWRTPDARNLMVVGNEKTTQIASLPLLSWYFEIFKAVLFSGGVRLMIVGYGFQGDAGQSRHRRDSNRAPPRRLSGDALSLHPHRANREYLRRLRTPALPQKPDAAGGFGGCR